MNRRSGSGSEPFLMEMLAVVGFLLSVPPSVFPYLQEQTG